VDWISYPLLYNTGMRLMECVRLPVQDVDFPHHQAAAALT
jgi:site-specific recombinase XerD